LGFTVGLLDNPSHFQNPKHKPESASAAAHYNNNNNTAERGWHSTGRERENRQKGSKESRL